jgi:hypothetical protein
MSGTPLPKDFPPMVYLPCAEDVVDPAQARVDMRRTRDGRVALLAYSALDRLHTCCGAQQPWIVLPTAILDKLQQDDPFELLIRDVMIPKDERCGGVA